MHCTIEGEWLAVDPVIVGRQPPGHGTAERYVVMTHPQHGRVRVDVFGVGEEARCFEDTLRVGHGLWIGFGEHVHFVDLGGAAPDVHTHHLEAYFGSISELDGSVLVASAERVFKFAPRGQLLWRSEPVGMDGVIVESIDGGLVRGSGEWDPPGGWKPFSLNLATGRAV